MAKTKKPSRKLAVSSKRKTAVRKKSRRKGTQTKRRVATLKTKKNKVSNISSQAVARIMGLGQYRIDSSTVSALNKIDNEIVKLVNGKESVPLTGNTDEKGNENIEPKFQKLLGQIISLIKKKGRPVKSHEIIPSDFMVPPSDISLEEARKMFRGEGLVPG